MPSVYCCLGAPTSNASCIARLIHGVQVHVGTYCMSGSRDRTVRLWNPHRGTHVNSYRGHSGDVRGLTIAADNASFVSAGEDRHINVWDVKTATTVRRFHGHEAAVNDVQYAADEALLVSASYDSTVAFWDLKARSSKALQSVKVATDAVTSLAITPRPLIIAASTDGTVSILDLRKGTLSCDRLHHPVTCVAAPSDGLYAAAACTDSCVRLLDRESGQVLAQYKGHQHEGFQLECALLRGDKVVACGSEDGASCLVYPILSCHG